MKISLAVGFV